MQKKKKETVANWGENRKTCELEFKKIEEICGNDRKPGSQCKKKAFLISEVEHIWQVHEKDTQWSKELKFEDYNVHV